MRVIVGVAFAAALAATSSQALAHNGVEVGFLECRGQTAAFVNSDGNITFGEGDNASTARDVGRLLAGAPRVARLSCN